MSVLISVAGNDFVVETATAVRERYLAPTLGDLLEWLRIELNDVLTEGNLAGTYTREELTHFLNRAKTEVELRTRCHRRRVTVPLAAGVHTYDTSPLFEVAEVSHGGATLTVTQLEDMATLSQAWDDTGAGQPTAVLQLSGSWMRIYPPPDATAGTQPLAVHGYATSAALVEDGDLVDSIPTGYASDVLLEGAKAFAYRARASNPVNVTLAGEAAAKFEALCGAIVQARKAGAI